MKASALKALQFLGPNFRPTTTLELSEAFNVSPPRTAQILRPLCYLGGHDHNMTVYRLGAHLWAITGRGQSALGLERTADRDCMDYLSVQCDALIDDPALEEFALDVLKWINWYVMPRRFRKKAALTASIHLAAHPWVSSRTPREKAWSAYRNSFSTLPETRQREVIAVVRKSMDNSDYVWWSSWARRRDRVIGKLEL